MGLDEIKQQLINDAKQEAQKIEHETEEQIKKIEEEATKTKNELKAKAQKELHETTEILRKRKIAQTKFESQRKKLNVKKQAIEQTIEETINTVTKMSEQDKTSLLQTLLEMAQQEIEVETVYVNKNDQKLIKFPKVISTEIEGGLIAENKDKTISVNYSIESMLERIKEQKLTQIGEELFKWIKSAN